MINLVKVRGESMAPTLAPGDYVITTKARAIRSGFVVLADHPKYGLIIKRVKSVQNQTVTLEGDGQASTSSEAMGHVARDKIRGRVWAAVTPKGLKRL